MGASIKAAGGGGRKGRRKRSSPMSEINITPFVDVMLVLLIVFMVAAPLLTGGVPLDLPKAKTVPLQAQAKERVVVSITKDGSIFLGKNDKDAISLAQLAPKLKLVMEGRGADGGSDAIHIKGDKLAQYGVVAKVLANLKEAGFSKLNLITEISEDKAGGG